MRAVIQRVSSAQVSVDDSIIGKIDKGLLVFFAVHVDDTEKMIEKMADKILKLRIFEDSEEKMNLSLEDTEGEILVVSQFTLYGDTKKGNRPSFIESARPEKAIPFYEKFVTILKEKNIKVEAGKFGADMQVELINDGPVTIIIDI
ncbi:MAG: D-aminoacyl-tRNA deacylase [Patescibacteria group bacterium]|jgi:D-tyrosyl-tRNA(Tyr) deacylase|nr:D-aminoacyl-tRNA deacylase [Patescibacteria group bacterium]